MDLNNIQTIDDLYEYIGHGIYEALPEEWHEAWTSVSIFSSGNRIQSRSGFKLNQETHYFNVNKIDGLLRDDRDIHEAFYLLLKFMRKDENDIPWNKARFWMNEDGDFSIDFKFDEDFAWYNSIEADSDEFKKLNSKEMDQIESWEGLPEDAPRSWR
ncbi:immunity protein YezG family protein [Algicola sagamiensis]|uniref:immunity protein YezG family protein n=1 Tax=Algicola sagamiensis TaxID=163869 RepID=UPI00036341C4|nr:immunity protein YezG family protein [Algicola sagamiensis]